MIKLFNLTQSGPWQTAGIDTDYKIVLDGECLYLVFEGSAEPSDWKANFDFFPKPVKPYKNMAKTWYAHGGFVKRWKAAEDQITSEVLSAIGDRQLVIVGYSHGAGLAALAHEWFEFYGHEPLGYGFGGPRVLWISGKMIRNRMWYFKAICNRGDIVTHLPFFIFGYMHNRKLKIGKQRLIGIDAHRPKSYKDSLKG